MTHAEATQTKTLQTKTGSAYITEDGQVIDEHELIRFVDGNGHGGCFYTTLERAETSWKRWIDSAVRRDHRDAENARYTAATAAYEARETADPFACFA